MRWLLLASLLTFSGVPAHAKGFSGGGFHSYSSSHYSATPHFSAPEMHSSPSFSSSRSYSSPSRSYFSSGSSYHPFGGFSHPYFWGRAYGNSYSSSSTYNTSYSSSTYTAGPADAKAALAILGIGAVLGVFGLFLGGRLG